MINTITLTFTGKYSTLDELRSKVARNNEAHKAGHGTCLMYNEQTCTGTLTIECTDLKDVEEITKLANE